MPTCSPFPSRLPRRKSNNVPARPLVPGGVLNLAHIDVAGHHHISQDQHGHYYQNKKGKQKGPRQQPQQMRQESYQHCYYYNTNYNLSNPSNNPGKELKCSTAKPINQLDNSSDRLTGDTAPSPKDKVNRGGISSTVRVCLFQKTEDMRSRLTFVQVQSKDIGARRGSRSSELSLATHNLNDRMKNPKLIGADIYIARLGKVQYDLGRPQKGGANITSKKGLNPDTENSCCSSIPLPTRTSSSGSLHDELTCKDHKPFTPMSCLSDADLTFDHRQLRDSRPCYRCVVYMHSAGIRRCFWTNNEGRWENAKVRDLFDQLVGAGSPDEEGNNGERSASVFITKHEVLRLRRLADRGG